MAIILSRNNQEIIIDDENYSLFEPYKWYVRLGYASRSHRVGNGKSIYYSMHRLVIGATDNQIVDHINRNTLDNRKDNLRIVTKAQNQWNKGTMSTNTSGFPGVYFCTDKNRKNKPWKASISVHRKRIFLGYFSSADEAYLAYLTGKAKYHVY